MLLGVWQMTATSVTAKAVTLCRLQSLKAEDFLGACAVFCIDSTGYEG